MNTYAIEVAKMVWKGRDLRVGDVIIATISHAPEQTWMAEVLFGLNDYRHGGFELEDEAKEFAEEAAAEFLERLKG